MRVEARVVGQFADGQGDGGLRGREHPDAEQGAAPRITLGTAIAVAISWTKNGSVLWAILHGLLSWFYVGYHVLTR